MWHEARRQEKQLRARMVDGSKRAERRRKYYENIRRDPDQFMQIHGTKCHIHADRAIARAAEDVNILRPWQGDQEIMIDRFDARSHLDYIETSEKPPKLTSMEEKEELICNFERYRLLIMNDFKDISEKAVLKNISEKEFWLTGQTEDIRKQELEKRRKAAESKTTIGFTYGDSEVVSGRNDAESSSDEDVLQTEELDADLEVYLLNAESQKRCNKFGENYGVVDSHFCALFKADQQAQRTAAELKRLDRQKASLVGRDAKGDRQLLKQERAILIANAKQEEALISLSSFAQKPKETSIVLAQSSSSSSEDEPSKPEFILSFGNDDEDKKRKRSKRSKNGKDRKRSRSRKRERRRRSPSSSPDRRRRRSRNRRSRSKDRRLSHSRDLKRSRRSRSYDRKRRRRSSSSSRSKSPLRYENQAASAPVFQEQMVKIESSDDDNGPITLLEIRSSMSESEKERIEIENRKRRVRRTKRMVKSKAHQSSKSIREKSEEKNDEAQVIKKKMKKALKVTVEELKEEEEEKRREAEKERRIRDEIIQLKQLERKIREQKKLDDMRQADLTRAILDARNKAEMCRRQLRSESPED